MLGSVDVVGPDGAVDLHGRKPRALVASLVVHRPDARTSAQLMDDLWPAGAPPAASGALQAYISRLRRLLGASAMQRTSAGYRLDCDVDVDRFVASLTEASRATTPERAAQRLRRGLMLWRGVPFGDVGDEDFARVEAVRLWELRGDALEDLFQAEPAGAGTTS